MQEFFKKWKNKFILLMSAQKTQSHLFQSPWGLNIAGNRVGYGENEGVLLNSNNILICKNGCN